MNCLTVFTLEYFDVYFLKKKKRGPSLMLPQLSKSGRYSNSTRDFTGTFYLINGGNLVFIQHILSW